MWNKTFARGSEKIIGPSYHNLIINLLISSILHFIALLIIQIVDLFYEIFNYDEEIYIFYYLNFFFTGATIFSLIFLLILNILFSSSFHDNYEPKSEFFAFIKLNFTLFCLWTILLLATGIPRVIIFLLNKDKFCFSITILIYLKIPLLISIYLQSIVIYVLYKESKIEEYGHEAGFY